MNYVKFGITFIISVVLCILGACAMTGAYYQSFMTEFGYTFGDNHSSVYLMSILTLLGLMMYSYSVSFLTVSKKYILWIVALVIVFAPVAYFLISPLSMEDRVYKQALNNYGYNFKLRTKADQEKMYQHPDYIQYKSHLDNFENDKATRVEYVALLNENVAKFNKYTEDQRRTKLGDNFYYYLYGKDYNTFLFRYKGIEDETVQKELYNITKSGVVSYNDMMDFQAKFVENYKNKTTDAINVPEQPTGTDVLTPTIPEDNKNIKEGGDVMKTVEPDVLTKEK